MAAIVGTVCWGQLSGVAEDNTRNFGDNWTGTGSFTGTKGQNDEAIALDAGEYEESEIVNTGARTIQLLQNVYGAGDTTTIK
jgi:hypothetical protein